MRSSIFYSKQEDIINKKKVEITDRRTLLSSRLIESFKTKDKRYSFRDSKVIGLRLYIFEGGQKTFYYSCTTKDKEKGLKKLDLFRSFNVKQARNVAKQIATDVMDGLSPIEIIILRSGELTVSELVRVFLDIVLKTPRYKHGIQKKWSTNDDSWTFQVLNDFIVKTIHVNGSVDKKILIKVDPKLILM
jgi:hypothetical protein